MRTRNSKVPGQVTPAKKGSKTPVKTGSPQPSTTTEDLETKQESESMEIKTETNAEEITTSVEANGDDKKAEDSHTASGDKPQESDTKASKASTPASVKKQKKATPSKKASAVTGEGEQETVAEVVKGLSGTEAIDEKKDIETIEIKDDADETKAETEPAAGDDEMEEAVEEGGGEEVEEEVEEDAVEGEGECDEAAENEEDLENEMEEEENEEGDEEEDEEGADENNEGEELEGLDIAEEHPELQEPRPVTERQKRKKLEVFVGGLDREATEEDVKKAFDNVGEVVEVRLTRNSQTGKNKGYAFVRFATAEQATRAATELERTQIKGKSCAVVPSEDNDVLFIGNISKSWKIQQVEEKLKEYGIDGIEELTLTEDPQNEGMNHGFAFLELATHNDAVKAFKRLVMPDAFFGSDKSAKVAWAQQNDETDEAVMSQVKSVFVDGILSSWTEEKVKELFGQYGEIERIVLARNMPRSKRNDFAFVNYVARDAAIACIDFLKDNELIDGENKIKVKVKLAKPQPKGRGKRIVRGGYPLQRNIRPGRGRGGVSRGRIISRKPVRGGKGFVRQSRSIGGRRAYEIPPAPKLPRIFRQRELEERPWHLGRPRGRRPLGGPARPSRVPLREEFPRPADVRRGRAGYFDRLNHEYRGRYEEIRDDFLPPPRGDGFPDSLPSRRGRSVRNLAPPPPDDGYMRRADRGYDYGRDVSAGFSRARDYGELGPGIKRPYSSLEEDHFYDSGPRGYTRARIDYDIPQPPAQYESGRAPLGRSGLGVSTGRSPVPPLSVSQPSFGVYDQAGAFASGGSSSLYGSGSHGYGSALPGAADYTSGGAEIRTASLYGSRSTSGGYGYPGSGSGYY